MRVKGFGGDGEINSGYEKVGSDGDNRVSSG